MADIWVAWAAGLYEGEGCISQWLVKRSHKGIDYTPYRVASMSVGMTDREPIERFRNIFGCGRLTVITNRGLKLDGNPCKPIFKWSCSRRGDIMMVCKMIRPFLSPRRTEQMDKALDGLTAAPRKRYCSSWEYGPPCGRYNPDKPSPAGYKYHRRRGETPCLGCMAAVRLYAKTTARGH